MRFNLRIDTPLQTKMLIDSFVGLVLVVVGVAGVVSVKFNGDIKLLITSAAALTGGLGVLAAGSVRKDLYDHIQDLVENRKVDDV